MRRAPEWHREPCSASARNTITNRHLKGLQRPEARQERRAWSEHVQLMTGTRTVSKTRNRLHHESKSRKIGFDRKNEKGGCSADRRRRWCRHGGEGGRARVMQTRGDTEAGEIQQTRHRNGGTTQPATTDEHK